jgi:hypothetical protein
LSWRAPQITGINPAATAWSTRTGASTAGPARSSSSSATAAAGNSAAGNSTTEAETRSGTPAASSATRKAAAFRGENHLQHLVGIFKKVAELVAVRAQCFRGELRGNLDSSDGRIFRDVANLVYLDAVFAGERGFQLLRQRSRFRVSAGESTHEARQLRLRQSR